jgi:tetratricopeptide (TPR) repeat protein
VSESSSQESPPPPASAVHQALEDPEVRQALATALFEALESRRPPKMWERFRPWVAAGASALITLLAFFLPSLQDQWDRFHARQVVQRYVELGRAFTQEERYALAEEAFAKAVELSENQRLDIEEERLEARVEQVNADPEWGKANPKSLKESDFLYLLQLRHGRGNTKQRARTLSSYGIFLASEHRLSEAEDAIRESVRLDTANAAAFVHLGNVLSDRGRGVEAEAAYRRGIALDSTSAPAYFDLGVLLEQCGRAPAAESAYRRAVALDPSDRDALRVLADLLERAGRLPEAQALRARVRALPARPSPAARGGVPASDGGSGEESKLGGPDTPP